MKVLLTKQIVGIRDRGLPTEHKQVYAEPGDKVHVLFDNTIEDDTQGLIGHFVCEKNDQDFVVFPSQFNLIIKERENARDDLFYPEPTEEPIEYFDE